MSDSVRPHRRQPTRLPCPWILQARTLEWVAISFSNAGKWKVKVKSLSRIRRLATPWTAAYQAPLSMGFSRQEYWSGVPLPSPIKGIDISKKKYFTFQAIWKVCVMLLFKYVCCLVFIPSPHVMQYLNLFCLSFHYFFLLWLFLSYFYFVVFKSFLNSSYYIIKFLVESSIPCN